MLRVCVNWPVKLYVSVKFSVFRFFIIAILNWMLFCEPFCMTLPRWMISFHRLSLLFKLSKGIQFSASRKPIVSDVALDCEYSYTIWDVCTFLSEFSLFHVRSNPQPPCPDVSYRRMRPLLLSCPALCFLIFPFTRILTDIAYWYISSPSDESYFTCSRRRCLLFLPFPRNAAAASTAENPETAARALR